MNNTSLPKVGGHTRPLQSLLGGVGKQPRLCNMKSRQEIEKLQASMQDLPTMPVRQQRLANLLQIIGQTPMANLLSVRT